MTLPSRTGRTAAGSAVRRNHVRVVGNPDGPVLLLAHGFGCDQQMWSRLLPHFTETHRVVLFDHVGAGGSDLTSYDSRKYSSLAGYAEDLLDLCDALELQETVVVAHSVSAMIAVTAAVRRPDLFADLVLVAPSPCYLDDPDDGYVGGFSREDVEDLLTSLENNYFAWAAAMAPMVMGDPTQPELGDELAVSFCSLDPRVARDFARVTFLSDSRDLLPQVRTPSLVLQCTDDALAPVQVGNYLSRRLPGSTLVRLSAIGHCPHVSAAEETAAAIQRYLRGGHAAPER